MQSETATSLSAPMKSLAVLPSDMAPGNVISRKIHYAVVSGHDETDETKVVTWHQGPQETVHDGASLDVAPSTGHHFYRYERDNV